MSKISKEAEKYAIDRQKLVNDYFDDEVIRTWEPLAGAYEAGYLKAAELIRKQEETFWAKNGIVNATSSWAKWLEELYYKEEQ